MLTNFIIAQIIGIIAKKYKKKIINISNSF